MNPFRLYAATGDAVAQLNIVDGTSVQTTIVLGHEHQSREGRIVNGVMCNALPHSPLKCERAHRHLPTQLHPRKDQAEQDTKG
jgi:hypothetical protein